MSTQASVFEHFISNSEELIWRMGKVWELCTSCKLHHWGVLGRFWSVEPVLSPALSCSLATWVDLHAYLQSPEASLSWSLPCYKNNLLTLFICFYYLISHCPWLSRAWRLSLKSRHAVTIYKDGELALQVKCLLVFFQVISLSSALSGLLHYLLKCWPFPAPRPFRAPWVHSFLSH